MDMYRSTKKRLLLLLEGALYIYIYIYIYAFLTKREFKMAEYWPSVENAKKNEANVNPPCHNKFGQ